MSDVAIRDAAPSDRAEIVRLMGEMKTHHRTFDPDERRFTVAPEELEDFTAGVLTEAGTTVLVAGDETRLLGFALFRNVRKSWGTSCEVDLLAVDEGHRGRGLGTAIMSAVEERARASGADAMRLAVSLGNDGAMRFYERLGYERSSIRLAKELQE